ncbi:MAG: DUF445 family protein [Leptospiraceae bacterium]|nr:DUF445 family protein [Leptospiraceae bacterium]
MMSTAATSQSDQNDPQYPPGGITDGPGADELLRFLERWAGRLAPESDPPEPIPETPAGRSSVFLLFLKLLPWLSIAGFIASMFVDIGDYWQTSFYLPWRADPVSMDGMLRMLTVTGLVGYGTNWLAIKMLFYPRKKRPLLGQGLIPSRKDHIVMRLGIQISKEIINSELILEQIRKSGLITHHRHKLTKSLRNMFSDPEFQQDITGLTEHYVNHLIRSPQFQDRIKDFIKSLDFDNMGLIEGGLLRMYKLISGNEDMTAKLQEVVENLTFRMQPFEKRLMDFLHQLPDQLEDQGHVVENYALGAIVFMIEQVNVQRVIVDNLQRFDEARLEQLLWKSTSDQLQYIQYLGCFLGIIGGFFIWLPLESLTITLLAGSLVWGLDVLIIRLRAGRSNSRPDTQSAS